jgi:YVTN family beta-propeller protein
MERPSPKITVSPRRLNVFTISKSHAFSLVVAILTCLLATAGSPPASAQSFAYVPNSRGNTVSVINTVTNTVAVTVTVGNNPYFVAITPDGTMAYVTNNSDSTVSVINTATNMVVATVTVGGPPLGVAVTPNGAFAYVTNTSANTVSVINTASNTVVATVPAGAVTNAVVISPSGAFAYIVNDHTVSVMSIATNTVVATVPVPSGSGSTDGPGVAITPNGAFVYVSVGEGNITVISTATNTVVATVSTTGNIRGSELGGVAFTPNGAFGYPAVGGFNEVAVFDTTNTVVATVPVGAFPASVAITANGTFAYVTNQNDNTVSVINTAANTVVATVPVGPGPYGVAITRFVDNDSQFSQLNGGNTFTGNQTVNGNVAATNFIGNGAGLTGVNASSLGGVTAGNFARQDIGNIFSGNQIVNGNVTASAFFGNGAGLTGIVASTANTANFALSAGDAMTLGLVPAANYARLDIGNIFTGNQTVPSLTVGPITGGFGSAFNVDPAGNIFLGASSIADMNGNFPSVHFDLSALAVNAGTPVAQTFRWQAEPVSLGRGNPPSFSLNLLSGPGGAQLSETGFSFNPNGTINFARGQIFPGAGGTITGVTAGGGLFGGGTTGNVSLGIPAGGVTNTMLFNPSLNVIAGAGLTGGGTVPLGGSTTLSLASGTCGAGTAVTALPLACTPFPIFGANIFTGNQTMPNLAVTGLISNGGG